MPAKHRPKKAPSGRSEESAAPASKIRGFVCAANFGEYREFATTIRKREPYFAAEFRDGFRVPDKDIEPAEWDFRSITSAEEAWLALRWEYDREIEWQYDLQAEIFSASTFVAGTRERKLAGAHFRSRWLHELPPRIDNHSQTQLYFPLPWTALPREFRKPWKAILASVRPLELEEYTRRASHLPSRVDPWLPCALEIDVSAPRTMIRKDMERCLNKLLDDRPVITRRGKDPNDIFARLKELAAYRMKRAGISYEAAIQRICERRRAFPAVDPFSVLPSFGSAGRWSSSAKNASKVLGSWGSDPRL